MEQIEIYQISIIKIIIGIFPFKVDPVSKYRGKRFPEYPENQERFRACYVSFSHHEFVEFH
jgi:hypothetical protein